MLSILSFGDKMYQYDVYVKFGTNSEQVVKTFFDDQHDDALKEAKAFLDRNHKKFNSARIVKRIVPLL
jgi:hypothetical protein